MREWKMEISRQRNQFFLYLSSSIQTQPDVAKAKTWPALCPAPPIPRDTLTLTPPTYPIQSYHYSPPRSTLSFPSVQIPDSQYQVAIANPHPRDQQSNPIYPIKITHWDFQSLPIIAHLSIASKWITQLLLLPSNTVHQHSKHIDLTWARLAICFRPIPSHQNVVMSKLSPSTNPLGPTKPLRFLRFP